MRTRAILSTALFIILSGLTDLTLPDVTTAQVIKSGPATCQGVALTFDLCPVRRGDGYDEELVEFLIANRVPATFFMSGKWVGKHDAQVRRILEVPYFEVGTHGDIHAHLPMQNEDEQRREILGPVTLLKTKYDHKANLFRPPYGEFNDLTIEVVKSLGLQFILWNAVSGDPDPQLSAVHIKERLKRSVRKGSIIVMHANGKGKHTREVVEDLAQHLLPARGLTPMTISNLLTCSRRTH